MAREWLGSTCSAVGRGVAQRRLSARSRGRRHRSTAVGCRGAEGRCGVGDTAFCGSRVDRSYARSLYSRSNGSQSENWWKNRGKLRVMLEETWVRRLWRMEVTRQKEPEQTTADSTYCCVRVQKATVVLLSSFLRLSW